MFVIRTKCFPMFWGNFVLVGIKTFQSCFKRLNGRYRYVPLGPPETWKRPWTSPWSALGPPETPWNPMGRLWNSLEHSWNSPKSSGTSWDSMELLGTQTLWLVFSSHLQFYRQSSYDNYFHHVFPSHNPNQLTVKYLCIGRNVINIHTTKR